MLYFGQNVGEPGAEEAGFGAPSRTSIYDYIGVPKHQQWMNKGKFDGAGLSAEERELDEFYTTLLNFTKNSLALTGEYREIHSYNRKHTQWYNDRVFSFVRWKGEDHLIIVSNFDAEASFGFVLQLPREIIEAWKLEEGSYQLEDQLSGQKLELHIREGYAELRIDMEPLRSFILQLQ
jgi:glycosidase